MTVAIIAGLITFAVTTLVTTAGVGAAFVLVPIFIALGVDVRVAMATCLLLNSVALLVALPRFAKNRLVVWKTAVPILIAASLLSPAGAYVSHYLDRDLLLWIFVGFLLFASSMMLFYSPQQREDASSKKLAGYGAGAGGFAGFMAGLLGVGGGNFINPTLVGLGFDPKKASATTSFVVIFSSLAGFLSHASLGNFDLLLVLCAGAGSAGGALLGSWLMTERLRSKHVKKIIGVILLMLAAKMVYDLLV